MPDQNTPDFLAPLDKVAGKAADMKKKFPKAISKSTDPDRKITIRDLFTKALKGLSYDAKMQVLANIRAEIPANKAPASGTMDIDKLGKDFMAIPKDRDKTTNAAARASDARDAKSAVPPLPELPDDELKRLAKTDVDSPEDKEWLSKVKEVRNHW